MYISGNVIEEIPTLIKRKQALKRQYRNDPTSSSFRVEPLGVGDYYGFEIDGNRRFLLEDYTVTHNTSSSLGILNNNSLNGISSLFFSLDMGAPLVYQRLIQKHLGYSDKKIYNIYQNNNTKEIELIEKTIADNYKNVKFCFRSGFSIEDIRNSIIKYQDTTGEKVRLVVVDYLECISGPFSDATANSGYVAQALKDIANDLELAIIILLQPQKAAGDPSEELMSYRNIKGSSQIEQCLSVIFTLWRPGFNPKNPDEDKYASIAVVKNRMGPLAKFDFLWEGLTGDLEELDEYQKEELKELVERKRKEKLAKDLI
jgi:replicative DNA helicase